MAEQGIIWLMNDETTQALLDLNRGFYENFAPSFAATRRRIQPGVRRVLLGLPPGGDWLDLGCGSGALACEWARCGRTGLYWGMDFSAGLLAEAREAVRGETLPPGLAVNFSQASLADPDWDAGLQNRVWDGVLCFAALHHLPGQALRERLLRQVRSRLQPGGFFIHSEWQFQHSARLMARRLPWEEAGLAPGALEPGDTLLDWRQEQADRPGERGLRYVHLFDRAELTALAETCGFRVLEEFESDGEGSRLGLYQIWGAI